MYEVKARDTLSNPKRVKTHDIYDLGRIEVAGQKVSAQVMVATDLIMTHGIVHKSEIPLKGELETALTVFWLKLMLDNTGLKHHLLVSGIAIYDYLPGERRDYPEDFHRRAIITRKLPTLDVMFGVQVYLTGEFYNSYRAGSDPYGHRLKPGLPKMNDFNPPLFAPMSHHGRMVDASITYDRHPDAVQLAQNFFRLARKALDSNGMDIISSSVEIGRDFDGHVYLSGSILSPDTTWFMHLSDAAKHTEPLVFTADLASGEAKRIWGNTGRRPIHFGPRTTQRLSQHYQEIFKSITGMHLRAFQRAYMD